MLAEGMAALRRWLALVLAVAALAGCAVALTGGYDEAVETGLQALHRDTALFLYRQEGRPQGFDEAADYYDRTRAGIATLLLRVRQDPLNGRFAKVLEALAANVELMRRQHRQDGAAAFSGDGAQAWRRILDQDFGLAMLIMDGRRRGAAQ